MSDDKYRHNSILIKNMHETIKLIESSRKGIIRIWKFYNEELLKKINVINKGLYGICYGIMIIYLLDVKMKQ